MKGILLFARVPMNVVCLKPIYEALKGETPFWGTVKPPKGTKGGNLFAPLGLRVKTVASWLAPWLPLDIYLSPDVMVVGKLCRWKIHTFHGVSFKGRAYTSKILAYDRLFIIGPYMEERFIEKGILKKGDPRIVRVGMPKLDSLVNGTWPQDKAIEHLGLDRDATVVLYAPTWGAGSSLKALGEAVVKTVLGLGLTLVVKLHDHTSRDPFWKEKVEEWEAAGAVIYRDPDVVPAMAASHLLISDLSSVANEYLLLDRPLVYLTAPGYEKRYGETVDLETWGFAAGPLVKDGKDLKRALIEALDYPRAYSDVRREMATHLFYNPGQATQKAVDVIREIISE